MAAGYTANAVNQYTQVTTPQTSFVRGSAAGAATVTVKGQTAPLGTGGTFNARVTTPGAATIVATAPDGSTSTETRTVALPPPTFAPSYDADGNMLSDGLWNYTWDGENRLVALESTAANPLPQRVLKRFRYDFQSRRIAEERYLFDAAQGSGGTYVLEKAQRWIYDGWNQTLELLNDRPVRVYVWGLDLSGTREGAGGVGGLLSSVDLVGGETWDYLFDGNGNVVGLADGSSGSIVGEYVYGPFGGEVIVRGEASRLNRIRFSTKLMEPDSRLLYYGYRFYDSERGRWLSRDPIEEQDELNLYRFIRNDGSNQCDFLGLYLFVIFYYDRPDDDDAFKRAADTLKRNIESGPFFSTCDTVILKSAYTADDFVKAWREVNGIGEEIKEARILGHGGPGTLHFRGSVLASRDILHLPPLRFAPGGQIICQSCNSGVNDSTGFSVAGAFATSQNIAAVGQSGFTQFSTSKRVRNWFTRITGSSVDVYLWSYGDGGEDDTVGSARPGRRFKPGDNPGIPDTIQGTKTKVE